MRLHRNFQTNYYPFVKHIWVKCTDLVQIRKKYFLGETFVFTFFLSFIPEAIFDFLSEIGVLKKYEV